MDELKSSSFIQSHQFTFFIGQEGKPIVVHAAAIAATSPQLDALINGGMAESEKRCARIENIQVEDFIRFCEYAYRGDYTVPPCEILPPEPSPTSGNNQQNIDVDGWGNLRPSSTKKDKKGKKVRAAPEPSPIDTEYPQDSPVYDKPGLEATLEPVYEVRPISRAPLRTQLNNRNYLTDMGPKALILHHFEPKPNSAADQYFTPVLLAHARLYCFAHLRLIAPLKALTLDKLHKTLLNFKLYAKRIGDIIELARYAYSNPDLPDRNDDGTLDDLRNLVVEYIVCEIDTIGKHDEFVKYMEEGGEFVGDFWRLTRSYIA
jgi:hypothetical protein